MLMLVGQPTGLTYLGGKAMAESAGKPAAQDQILDASKMVRAPRGRRKVIDPKLVTVLANVQPGKMAVLSASFGAVPEADRSRVRAVIVKHWEEAGWKSAPTIAYTPEGYPQVAHRS